MEFARVELNLGGFGIVETRKPVVAGKAADHRAVLRRDVIEIIRGPQAVGARHVLYNDCRITRNEARHVLGEKPRILIVTAADRSGGDQRDLLAAVEIGGRLRLYSTRHQQKSDQPDNAAAHTPLLLSEYLFVVFAQVRRR